MGICQVANKPGVFVVIPRANLFLVVKGCCVIDKKYATPKQKIFFECRLEDLPNLFKVSAAL